MRDHDPAREAAFFALFKDYYDLETNSARRYTPTEYTLARMTPLAALAGNPERRLRIVHVAGTKGKGSTSFMIGALLDAAGHATGVFTSPHLATVRERFQMRGHLVAYDTLMTQAREFEADLRRNGLVPTLFEIMTVLALKLFVADGCEFVVLETGIGGLLDATNYVPAPECCAITPISFDHTELLGGTITEIAAQKAGIIKPGVPVVCGLQPYPEAERVVRQRAAELAAPVLDPLAAATVAAWPVTGLPGFQVDNFRTALAVTRALGIDAPPTRFQMPRPRARFECIHQAPLVILDAAHNADSARQLVRALREMHPGKDFTVILGVVKGKDVAGIVDALCALPGADFILTHPRTVKGSELTALEAAVRAAGLTYRVIPELTMRAQLPAGRHLLFTGSFFTAVLGELLFPA